MFTLASNLLSSVASPAFQKACENSRSRGELLKLNSCIQMIQSVLVDAEKMQENSAAVQDWIKRISDVLYDADDLFDEVATDYMLKQPIIKERKLLEKVRASCFMLNPFGSRNSIANQLKAIRKRLYQISIDMNQFGFLNRNCEEPISNAMADRETHPFVDTKWVIGRDEEKNVILKFLLQDQSNDDVSVTAIVGIGGMGKTTLAQLVYNDRKVKENFEKRWFACISNTIDDKGVIGKIFQSVCEKRFADFDLDQLQIRIRESINRRKFLLVLDDVWEDDYDTWKDRISLLRGGAKGSKIIVTTRSLKVARAVGASHAQTHNLEGLSDDESWNLFESIAFGPEQEHDPRQVELGREIVKKCANVPLAIRVVSIILYEKNTIAEWRSFIDTELSQLKLSDHLMQTLKLSYDHLPSNLKCCFAYCSLFPKGYVFDMEQLINLWIAQGYVKQPINEMLTAEEVGYSYFMELHWRSFFKQSERWNAYTMNYLIHDLAQLVAGGEIIAVTKPLHQFNKIPRHVSVGQDQVDTSWGCVAHMLNTGRLRSLIFLPPKDADKRLLLALDQQFTCGKYLRVLSLSYLRIKAVSSSIGELKYLRYLNLSGNSFERLPDSLTDLLNLLTLDIRECCNLEELPNHFRKLINLRHLNIRDCGELKHMPPGMEELSSLQKLSDFKVGKAIEGVKRSGLDALAGLKLKGELRIYFDGGIDNWDGDEFLQLPASLEQLIIWKYPGRGIHSLSLLPSLARLTLRDCHKVKHLSRLRCLPNLKFLNLDELSELEYIEDEEEERDDIYTTVTTRYFDNTALFFPCLEELKMSRLWKLKGWSRRKVEATTASSTGSWSLSFLLLSELTIESCGKLTSFPLCRSVRTLTIHDVDGGLVSVSDETFPSLKHCSIFNSGDLENLHLLGSRFLEKLKISNCDGLTRVKVESLPSLGFLEIARCNRLKSLRIASLNVLSEFKMWGCPKELDLWGLRQEKRCVDWDSLPNLRRLYVDTLPSPDVSVKLMRILKELRYMDNSVKEGALNLSPGKEIRPGSALSPSEITPVLKGHSSYWSDYDYPSKTLVEQEPASIALAHHPDTDAAGWENRGAAYREGLDKQEGEINESKYTYEIEEAEHQNIGASSQEVPYNLSTETDKDEFISGPIVMEEAEECLYVLSLLPKDYEFEEDMLIQLWMAGGLINDETTGNKHFSHLINQKYLLRSGTNFLTSKGRYHINIETCQKINHFPEGQNSTLKWENEFDTDKYSDGIQHVSLVFNGIDHTIFQKLQQFSELRTLLFLVNDCPLVKEIPTRFFQRFKKLRALDLSGTHIKNLPSSVDQLHHLRYLDLSRTLIEWLPDTICFLKEFQTLKLQECSKLRELPEQLSNLTELRDLDVDVLCRLTIMPRGMKALRNLRTLSAFLVGTKDGYKVNELETLNNLTGYFCIAMLENVESANEAKKAALHQKTNIKRLVLKWTAPEYSWKDTKSVASAVLECLEPCPFLEKLQILCYQGSTFPSWVSNPQFEKLVHVSFRKCENVCKLPPLEQLPFLKDLELVEMNSVEAFEVQGRSDMIAFPCLEKLRIDEMPSLRTWRWEKQNVADFKSLTEITINDCPRLRKFDVLPHLSSIKYLEIRKCPKVQSVSNSDLPKSLDVLMVDNFYVIRKNSMTSEDDDETEASYISSDDL